MDVEGIGEVTSPWTTLGIAQQLTNTWDLDAILNISLFSIFGLFWLFNYFIFERNRLQEENEILYFIGWNKRDIRQRNMIEQLLLVTLSLVISIGLALLFRFTTLSFIVIGLFFLMSMLLIGIVFFKSSHQKYRAMKYHFLASVRYYQALLLPSIFALILAISITQLQITSIYELWTTSVDTTLGEFVFTEGLFVRLFIVFVTILLSIFVIIEAIEGIIYERRDEFQMYYVLGWTEKMITTHFLKEVLIWTNLSLLLGTLISGILSIFVSETIANLWIGISFSTILYFVITFSLVTFRKFKVVL